MQLSRVIVVYNQPRVWLEITPPIRSVSTIEPVAQLLRVLHGLRNSRSLISKILGIEHRYAFEVSSSKPRGIRYFLQTAESDARQVERLITAQLRGAKVRAVVRPPTLYSQVISLRQANHYMYPLRQSDARNPDPLSYVISSMSRVSNDSELTYQLIIRPRLNQAAYRLTKRLLRNADMSNVKNSILGKGAARVMQLVSALSAGVANTASEIFTASTYGHRATVVSRPVLNRSIPPDRPERTVTPMEQLLISTITDKVSDALFEATIRIGSTSRSLSEVRSVASSFGGYRYGPYQSLAPKRKLPLSQAVSRTLFDKRVPSMSPLILSALELSSLFHTPEITSENADNTQVSLSRTLPAPISQKQGAGHTITIGINKHQGTETTIGITAAERERHMYVIGGTGNGKTTLLQYQIVQDMRQGNGVAVIDPHGDMAETLLRYVPRERIDDVIYFNPTDFERPIGVNLLELDQELEGNDLLHEKDLITESIVSVFRKIFSDEDSGGHRIEYVLRNTIQTALTVEGATLFTIYDLLNDPKYRLKIIRDLEDENLKNFWKHELGKAGEMQKVKMAAGITSKIGRFLFSASAKRILGQQKSTINFVDIINDKKILICNLSKGSIGEDTSELYGIMILAKLQLASLKRAMIPINERTPFYLYVDEFQNFATQSFVQMLSESRKYKLALIMAEQSTSQQDDQQMVNIILANAGTIICFKSGNPHDEKLLLPLFAPFIEAGEISNLPSYHFYAKLSAVHSQEPMSGETLLLEEKGSDEISRLTVQQSRTKYGREIQDDVSKKEKTHAGRGNAVKPRPKLIDD